MASELSGRAGVRVRQFRSDDVGSVAGLSEQLGYPASIEETKRRLTGIETDPAHAVYVAELSAGEVVGWVHVYACDLIVAERQAMVGGLVIDERVRRRGIGRLLMEKAERWARQHRCLSISLRTNVIRNDAHEFYKRIGYQRVKTQHKFQKQLNGGGTS
jgi:GNAT superfamily N-acetyltransferase